MAVIQPEDGGQARTRVDAGEELLVVFGADWCERSTALADRIEAADAPVPVLLVDVEQAPGFAHEHGVETLPTLVRFEHGREVERDAGRVTDLDPFLDA